MAKPKDAKPADQAAPEPPLYEDPAPDLLQDGQEEVFSHAAVERGLAQDPRALGPQVIEGGDLKRQSDDAERP